ncbi:MAG: GNAT family N-acetyltransferase [Pirellulaceae bacterium]
MPTITVDLATPLVRSFRTEQLAGLFDLPVEERLAHRLTAEVPGMDEPWTIGAIVGPSGSGKTTLARAAFGDALHTPGDWPSNAALIDALSDAASDCSLKQLTRLLTAVGLSTPLAWLKPYRVLSTGERFRADLARAILRAPSLLVCDEFTSTLDRTVARTASAAITKHLRTTASLTPGLRLVALSCHTDFVPWLSPDWVLDLACSPPQLARGCLRRPDIRLAVRRVPQALWTRFARHHYLSGGLSTAATCYAAFWEGALVAFCAVVATLGHKRCKRITRLVTLPDFQGLGIGPRLAESAAEQQRGQGFRVTITASHPAIVGYCSRSPRWRYVGLKKTGSTRQRLGERAIRCSTGRAVASFEYLGEPVAPGH